MRGLHPKIKQMAVATAAVVAGAVVTIVAAVPALAQDSTGTIVPLDHPFAPFLESRAFAESKGATAEFRKMEWVADDRSTTSSMWAMSEVSKGMSDGEGDIQVEENLCGIVYAGELDADYNMSQLTPADRRGPVRRDAEENQCDVNNIANPDNLMCGPRRPPLDRRGHLHACQQCVLDVGRHTTPLCYRA